MTDSPPEHTLPIDVEYEASGRRYVGTLMRTAAEPRALAVLLPDWRGRSRLALDHAAHLAGLGCTTLVADLYGDGHNPSDPGQVTPLVRRLLDNRADGVAALSAAVAAVRKAVGASAHPVVVIAFSAGAVTALDHGRRTREPAAIVVCSGLLQTAEPGTPTQIGAPHGWQMSPAAAAEAPVAEAPPCVDGGRTSNLQPGNNATAIRGREIHGSHGSPSGRTTALGQE